MKAGPYSRLGVPGHPLSAVSSGGLLLLLPPVACVREMCIRDRLYDEEAAVELSSNEPVEFRQKTINLASLAIQKKDIFRIREEMELPNGYPNIFDIFWQTCKLGETQFRLSEGKLSIQGEVQLFFLYEGEGENRPVMWYEAKICLLYTSRCV